MKSEKVKDAFRDFYQIFFLNGSHITIFLTPFIQELFNHSENKYVCFGIVLHSYVQSWGKTSR